MLPQKPILPFLRSRVLCDPAYRIARFWRKVTRGAADQCWPWTGAVHELGYGVVGWRIGRDEPTATMLFAHRVAWVIEHGREIREGYVIDHTCGNKSCCNPAHLECVTQTVNVERYHAQRPDTGTCKRGHPIERGEACAVCRRERVAAWKAANRDRWRTMQRRSDVKRGKLTGRHGGNITP